MSRRTARESAMRLLFESEFNIELDTQSTLELMEPIELTKQDKEYIGSVKEGVLSHTADIDPVIEKYARGWNLDRIAKVDKSILRLAIYEMMYTDVPQSIVINEAVKMARVFSSEQSASFINGILGSFSRSADA